MIGCPLRKTASSRLPISSPSRFMSITGAQRPVAITAGDVDEIALARAAHVRADQMEGRDVQVGRSSEVISIDKATLRSMSLTKGNSSSRSSSKASASTASSCVGMALSDGKLRRCRAPNRGGFLVVAGLIGDRAIGAQQGRGADSDHGREAAAFA